MTEVLFSNEIEQFTLHNKKCLKSEFHGVLKYELTRAVCSEWKKIALQNTTNQYNKIINARGLSNYEPMARSIFQNTLKELKGNIEKIWLITDSKIITGGASIMNMFTSVPIKVVSSENEIVL
jgi:hypothetical protein